MKRILTATACAIIYGGMLFGCAEAEVAKVEKQIYVNHQSLSMFVNDEITITASPTNETFHWESENTSVATVSATGSVRATGEGETNIIVSYDNNVTRTIPVSVVTKIPATGVTVSKARLELKPRGGAVLTAGLLPENSNDNVAILWRSSDPSIVTVTNGVVEALGTQGTASLYVRLDIAGAKEVEIPVEVSYTYPYNGPHILSAAAPKQIQARDFDTGGQNYGYYDTGTATGSPVYRPELSGNQPNIESGTHIGYVASGEWLQFTVEVADAGNYEVDFELTASGNGGKLHIEVDGTPSGGTVDVPNNGSWSAFGWISTRGATLPVIPLAKGKHKIKWYVDVATYNMRALKFTWKE